MFQSQSVHHMQCGQHDLSSCSPDVNTLSQVILIVPLQCRIITVMLVYTLAIESALNVTQSPNDCILTAPLLCILFYH